MPAINDPTVIAEVTACCEAYEKALISNDIPALTGFFWDSPEAVRFGVSEQLYGSEAIAAFRQKRVINFTERRTLRLTVLTLGHAAAVAMLEFSVVVAGQTRHGRQTQVWSRFADGDWRIVSAHVSHAAPTSAEAELALVDRAAAAVDLRLDPAHRTGVAEAMTRNAEIARPLLAFGLPETTESATVFYP